MRKLSELNVWVLATLQQRNRFEVLLDKECTSLNETNFTIPQSQHSKNSEIRSFACSDFPPTLTKLIWVKKSPALGSGLECSTNADGKSSGTSITGTGKD